MILVNIRDCYHSRFLLNYFYSRVKSFDGEGIRFKIISFLTSRIKRFRAVVANIFINLHVRSA
jgi:hypothetical protein